MGERRNGLHLDRVALLQWVVQNSGGVNHLPAQVAVVHVSHIQRLGGERIGLDVDIGSGDLCNFLS